MRTLLLFYLDSLDSLASRLSLNGRKKTKTNNERRGIIETENLLCQIRDSWPNEDNSDQFIT